MKPVSRRTGEKYISHTVKTMFGEVIRVRERVNTGHVTWNYKNKSIPGRLDSRKEYFIHRNTADEKIVKAFKRQRTPALYNGMYAPE